MVGPTNRYSIRVNVELVDSTEEVKELQAETDDYLKV